MRRDDMVSISRIDGDNWRISNRKQYSVANQQSSWALYGMKGQDVNHPATIGGAGAAVQAARDRGQTARFHCEDDRLFQK